MIAGLRCWFSAPDNSVVALFMSVYVTAMSEASSVSRRPANGRRRTDERCMPGLPDGFGTVPTDRRRVDTREVPRVTVSEGVALSD